MKLFDGHSYDGVSAAIGVIRTGGKSGCELVTLLSDRWLLLPYVSYRVIHTGVKFGCELVTPVSNRWLLLVTKVF